jgi:hypothetical protein
MGVEKIGITHAYPQLFYMCLLQLPNCFLVLPAHRAGDYAKRVRVRVKVNVGMRVRIKAIAIMIAISISYIAFPPLECCLLSAVC